MMLDSLCLQSSYSVCPWLLWNHPDCPYNPSPFTHCMQERNYMFLDFRVVNPLRKNNLTEGLTKQVSQKNRPLLKLVPKLKSKKCPILELLIQTCCVIVEAWLPIFVAFYFIVCNSYPACGYNEQWWDAITCSACSKPSLTSWLGLGFLMTLWTRDKWTASPFHKNPETRFDFRDVRRRQDHMYVNAVAPLQLHRCTPRPFHAKAHRSRCIFCEQNMDPSLYNLSPYHVILLQWVESRE